MSERRNANPQTVGRDVLRDLTARIERLERGGALRGQVSFDDTIQIGDVKISVQVTTGTGRKVVFTNVLSGATSTITL